MFALLIDYVHSKMQPTAFQATALQWVALSSIVEKERRECAKLIQLLFRFYSWKKRATEQLVSETEVMKKHEQFMKNYAAQKVVVAKLRKYEVSTL